MLFLFKLEVNVFNLDIIFCLYAGRTKILINGAEADCTRQGIVFLPIVTETFGGWHPDARREVKKLGAALARHTGQEEGEAVSHLCSRRSILLQRGNAAILGNRNPALPGAHVDGII